MQSHEDVTVDDLMRHASLPLLRQRRRFDALAGNEGGGGGGADTILVEDDTAPPPPPASKEEVEHTLLNMTRNALREFLHEFVATVLYSFLVRLAFEFALTIMVLGAAVGATVLGIHMGLAMSATLSFEFYLADKLSRRNLSSARLITYVFFNTIIQYLGSLLGTYMAHWVATELYAAVQSSTIKSPLNKMHQHITEGAADSLSTTALTVISIFSIIELMVVFSQQNSAHSGHHHQSSSVAIGRAAVQALAIWIAMPYIRYYTLTQWLAELTLFGRVSAVGSSALPNLLGKLIAFIISFGLYRMAIFIK